VVDRIGQVGVAWSEPMEPEAGSKVPDERPGAWAEHAADLGQAGRRVGPVVHRQHADNQVERLVREGQRGHVTDKKRRPGLVAAPRTVGVSSGATDHGRIEVQTGHLQAVLAANRIDR
jgi:hypothetical protein